MKIYPINPNRNQQISHKAVDKHYFKWAKKDIYMGIGLSGELLYQLERLALFNYMKPQDAIDTVEAIKKLLPEPREDVDRTLEYLKNLLPSENKRGV